MDCNLDSRTPHLGQSEWQAPICEVVVSSHTIEIARAEDGSAPESLRF